MTSIAKIKKQAEQLAKVFGPPVLYRVDVIADESGKWVTNGVRFGSYPEAQAYGLNLFSRWTSVREWRVVSEANVS